MDRAFQRIHSLMLRGTFYSVPPSYISLLYANSKRKKYLNLFVSSKKSRTFASRLLSKVYKGLILSVLIVLCPGTVRNAEKNCFLVVNI